MIPSQWMGAPRKSFAKNFPAFSPFFVLLFALLILASDLHAQVYQATLNHRRRGDQLWVEVWVKSLSSTAPKLGESSFVIQYNSSFLTPAATQAPSTTDTIMYDVDQASPVATLTSPFHSANGYNALGTQSFGAGYYSLEVRKTFGGTTGFQPGTTGRGTFVGLMKFDINPTSLTDATTSDVQWSTSALPGDIVIYDYNENNIESQVTLTNPGAYKIRGITVLNPNGPSEVVDRDKVYASVATGYPIYFERSGTGSTVQYATNAMAYQFDYSLNGGSSWTEIGRASEDDASVTAATGDIHNTTGITTTGGALVSTLTNGEGILRARWVADANFAGRSEEARIRITQLTTSGALSGRTAGTVSDNSDNNFTIGRLFFSQLNGTNQYFKTPGNFSNSTKLTVEGWVNLNSYKLAGSEPAIVASSAGSSSTEEGAWMLYLKDGKYPAFRAREILGRGTNGYIANIVSPTALSTSSDATPLVTAHSTNWTHIAATVSNGTVRLYVNGELVEEVVNDSATNIRMLTTNHPIWVGINPNGTITSENYLNAGLKGVRVWRTDLTQTQVRTLVSGIATPTNVGAAPGDANYFKRTLELCYTLEGTRTDAASNATYQGGDQAALFYQNGTNDNALTRFRPDRPHIKLTAPVGCEGVTNLTGNNYAVRWVAYGLGDHTTAASTDLRVQLSVDGGTTWGFAQSPAGTAAANELGGATGTAVDVENGTVDWLPYNNTATPNLRSVAATYSKSVVLRISGYATAQNEIYDQSATFAVAPYFSLSKAADTKIEIPGAASMNITGQTAFVEAWIRPYRFPTTGEDYFPIISKYDTASGKAHYMLGLKSTGQLVFKLTDASGTVRTAISDTSALIVKPNTIKVDSAWTHVGAWVNIGNGTGASEIRFYIDGTPQRADAITTQLGSAITLSSLNEYPTYLGYEPNGVSSRGFVGELRDIRFWNGTPGGAATTGSEPTALTTHVQGALNVLGSTLNGTSDDNLTAAFNLNGGSINPGGFTSSILNSGSTIRAIVSGTPMCYTAVQPQIKLVEPVFNQRVRNVTTDMAIRWVGFHYDGTAFVTGNTVGPVAPSVEFSINGGGGTAVQPYQYVGSDYWDGVTPAVDALALPVGKRFTNTTAGNVQYGAELNMTIADPDANDDGTTTDAAPLSATLTNARLRISNTYTINTTATTVQAEGPLFTVTPPSNFTVRAVLEGYHSGSDAAASFNNIATSYTGGGVRIKLYRNNSGTPGALVATAESEFQYDANARTASALTNKGTTTGDGEFFAAIPFVFTDLPDGSYWVVLEHPNHLPVMSKTPATFLYSGDVSTTVALESGWDFSSWTGADDHASYGAYGSAKSTTTHTSYATTGLMYNEGLQGVSGTTANYMIGLVGGDCEKDGQINAADRVRVRADASTALVRSDVTGNGAVDADDRTITDRNFGKVSSIYNVTFPSATVNNQNPLSIISPIDPVQSEYFNNNALSKVDLGTTLGLKAKNAVQADYEYTVSATPTRTGKVIDVPVYIQNNGSLFAMGNATFGVRFNPAKVKFVGLYDTQNNPFNNKPEKGYSPVYSAPKNNADNPVENLRTIEIDYDAYSNKGGELVSATKTHLGTLRFEVIGDASSVGFQWNSTNTLWTSTSQHLAKYGTYTPINGVMMYTAGITAPINGEKVATSRPYTVKWTATANAPVFVEYSIDGGATWVRTSDVAVESATLATKVTMPSTASADCFVRLVDEETGTEVARSKKFSVVAVTAAITYPTSVDPIYVGGANSVIRWNTEGLQTVRFEFSTNGTDWTEVSTTRNATDKSVSWKVPSVNSKSAVIRMIDAESQSEMVRSDEFRVLAGSLSFLNPNANDNLKASTKYTLKWRTQASVTNVDLQYSVDGGATFQTLATNVPAPKNLVDVTVPAANTSKAVIRAIFPGEPTLEYARTAQFRISGVTDVENPSAEGFSISTVNPTPTDNAGQFSITLPRAENVNVTVSTLLGENVLNILNNQVMDAGTHNINVTTTTLPAGTYILRFNAGATVLTQRIVVVR